MFSSALLISVNLPFICVLVFLSFMPTFCFTNLDELSPTYSRLVRVYCTNTAGSLLHATLCRHVIMNGRSITGICWRNLLNCSSKHSLWDSSQIGVMTWLRTRLPNGRGSILDGSKRFFISRSSGADPVNIGIFFHWGKATGGWSWQLESILRPC